MADKTNANIGFEKQLWKERVTRERGWQTERLPASTDGAQDFRNGYATTILNVP